MSLFAIADPHLSLDADKSMEVFRGWQDYVARLEANWRAVVGEEDTVVIAGDLSWGMSLAGALRDMQFLHSLPGRKLLLKGNHDYWWSTRRKMDTFFEEHGLHSLQIVHNDAALVEGIAVCGTRGWFFDAEEDADKKVVLREAGRLRTSIQAAKARGVDVVIIDTAGRLQNKSNLMDELGKIRRVTEKNLPVDEVLLVLDATTGQNGMAQAKVFAEAIGITGVVLSKLDGSAKGGIVVSVQKELGVPVKLVGLGEGPDDLAPFDPEGFVDGILA